MGVKAKKGLFGRMAAKVGLTKSNPPAPWFRHAMTALSLYIAACSFGSPTIWSEELTKAVREYGDLSRKSKYAGHRAGLETVVGVLEGAEWSGVRLFWDQCCSLFQPGPGASRAT